MQKWLLCSSFSTREIKNRNVHALWMYFPPGSVQLWVFDIGYIPSCGICFLGYHWLAPVGLCEEKLFWQDPGAQRSCWKLGEGQCRWNQEKVWVGLRDGITIDMSVEVLGCDLPPQKRTGTYRDDHMAQEVQRERTLREHVSCSHKFSCPYPHYYQKLSIYMHLGSFQSKVENKFMLIQLAHIH